jgi:uncharacterized protein (DUF2236 family)
VGAGVSEHSDFTADPWGRLFRTLDYACTMVYGGAQAAGETGRRMRELHRRISGIAPDGRQYRALEAEAYAWVHATLAEGIVAAHDRFGRRLGHDECEQLWSEWRTLGRLLGITAVELPAGWDGFRGYLAQMIESRLARTQAVDEVLQALSRPAPPRMHALYRTIWPLAWMPLSHLLGLLTGGLLPPTLRTRFDVPWGRREELELRVVASSLRAATPLMPASLQNTGPGYLRWREAARATPSESEPLTGATPRP